MSPEDARLRGTMPAVNDIAALGILFVVYLIRIGTIGPEYATPWPLTLMTDVVLPAIAASWLFIVAMLVAIEAVGAA